MFDEPQTSGGAEISLDFGCSVTLLDDWVRRHAAGAEISLDYGSGGSPLEQKKFLNFTLPHSRE